MKFENMCKQIINEAKKQKVIDGEKNKPNVITELDEENNDVETPVTPEAENEIIELEEPERTFIEKFIEFTEAKILNKAYKTIASDFRSVLGKNSKFAIEYLNKYKEERDKKCAALKEELKELQEKIKSEEKVKADAAERKLNIINLLNNARKKVETEK